jgi:hypothetical protein
MDPIRLQVVIPFHQSIAADSDDIEHAVSACYEPILSAIEEADEARVALHFSGHLLDHLSRKREDFLMRVKQLARAGRIEILGGLFYGSLPTLLGEADVRAQTQMAAEYWESFVGRAPSGFWLPELAWTAELPRMLDETGLEYGFVSASQLAVDPAQAHGVVTIERGGSRISAYVLSDVLSKAAIGSSVNEWIDGAVDNAQRAVKAVHTVWLRAEALGLENGAWARGWVPEWLRAISGERNELRSVLPGETFASARPARPAKLLHRCAEVVLGDSQRTESGDKREEAVDWPDFALQFPEVDALHRRMLRASDKLREAILAMEEEGMEERWSSDLATAQRLIFAAQAPDPYWCGRHEGFGDPRVRDAAMTRITRAERLIDALVQGEDDWISAEEEDRDGDLVEELIVTSRHLTAWIVPGDGARIRTLDDRISGRNVLDASSGKRGHLREQGMRDLVLDLDASPEELFSGSARELTTSDAPAFEVNESGIDEEGDLTYRLQVSANVHLSGHAASELAVSKTLAMPIDRAELTVTTHATASGSHGVLIATKIPVRLGTQECVLHVNGAAAREGRHDDVTELRVEAADGSAFELVSTSPIEVWTNAVARGDATKGLFVVPIMRVEGTAESTVMVRLAPVALAEEDAVEGDGGVDEGDEREDGGDEGGGQ